MTSADDPYLLYAGKSRAQVQLSQQQLTNLALQLALEELYAFVEQQGGKVDPTIVDRDGAEVTLYTNEHPCQNARETLTALIEQAGTGKGSDIKRVKAYNQLAGAHGFDLILKSSGPKTEESLLSKALRPQNSQKPRDIIRLTVIAPTLSHIDSFMEKLAISVDDFNRINSIAAAKDDHTPLEMTGSGFMKHTYNKSLGGIPTEIQGVLEQLATTAARITHKYFQVSRGWEVYERDKNEKTRGAFTEEYNTIARFMRQFASDSPVPYAVWHEVNKALATPDISTVTFDKYSEGGRPTQTVYKKGEYSPIFEDYNALLNYREFVKKVGVTLPQPFMQELGKSANDESLAKAYNNMRLCCQITHACYICDAPEEARREYVRCALEINRKIKKDAHVKHSCKEAIPSVLIEAVAKGKNGPEIDVADLEADLQRRRSNRRL